MINARIEELYKAHGHYIYQRCCVILGDKTEAHDALHEVFIKLIDKQKSLEDGRSLLPWLNRVTTNHCFNRLRARRYRRHQDIESLGGVVDSTPLQFMTQLAEQRDVIRRLLLSSDQRTQYVVVGYFFDELPVNGIGEQLGISVPTVRRILKRFLERSRIKLEREEREVSKRSAASAQR